MLTPADIRELSNADLAREVSRSRDLLFRQKMGVRTGHLKDSHTIGQLKTLIARLLTIQAERTKAGTNITESSKTALEKIAAETKKLDEAAAPKKAKKTATKKEVVETESADVKVKKVEKKSLLAKVTQKAE